MQGVTHRQFMIMEVWLREEWNNPSRSDWYLMQIARMWAGKDTSMEQLKLKFNTDTQASRKARTPAELKMQIAYSKHAWMQGMQVRKYMIRHPDSRLETVEI